MVTVTEKLRKIFNSQYNQDHASSLWSYARVHLNTSFTIQPSDALLNMSDESWFATAEGQLSQQQIVLSAEPILKYIKRCVDYHNEVMDSFSRKFNCGSLFLTLIGGTLIALAAAGAISFSGGIVIGAGVLAFAIIVACIPFSRMKIDFSITGEPPVEPQKSCKDRILAQFFKPDGSETGYHSGVESKCC